MNNRAAKQDDPIVRELVDIKKLLILDLFVRGVEASQIARMLEMDQGGFSRAFPMREILRKPKKKS